VLEPYSGVTLPVPQDSLSVSRDISTSLNLLFLFGFYSFFFFSSSFFWSQSVTAEEPQIILDWRGEILYSYNPETRNDRGYVNYKPQVWFNSTVQ
jgi:hypothetical protein